MSDLLKPFRSAYRDRGVAVARRWRAEGSAVVGCVGPDVPVELVSAAGLLPLGIRGDPDDPSAAGEPYLGPTTDPAARSMLGTLLGGGCSHLDRLLIGHDSEASLRLFVGLRELARLGDPVALEPHFVDLLHLGRPSTALYDRRQLQRLRELLEGWSKAAISDTAITAAILAQNTNRALLRAVGELRRREPPLLSGVEALWIFGAGRSLPVGEHSAALEALLAGSSSLEARQGVRIFVTGSSHDHDGWYGALEGLGAVVVGEDHAGGDRLRAEPPAAGDDPLGALAEHYRHPPPSSSKAGVAHRARRAATAAVAAGAQAVVSFGRAHDPATGWDYPSQREALAEAGIPMLFLGGLAYAGFLDAAALSALAGFVTSVDGREAKGAAEGSLGVDR